MNSHYYLLFIIIWPNYRFENIFNFLLDSKILYKGLFDFQNNFISGREKFKSYFRNELCIFPTLSSKYWLLRGDKKFNHSDNNIKFDLKN